jgi:hypothetical protein
VPTHPIYYPVYPEHPIELPPDASTPGLTPEHPILLPGDTVTLYVSRGPSKPVEVAIPK